MKHSLFIITLLLLFPISSFAATGIILKPSLEAQMKLQTIQDKKAANIHKLAELRSKRLTPKTVAPTTQTKSGTTTVNQKIIRPAIQSISSPTSQPTIPGVDMSRVRAAWISWYNDVRKGVGLNPYSYDNRLDATAYAWNKTFANGRGQNHHRRNPGDAYYDYPVITTWFKDRGVVGKVKGGVTTTENVGWGTYSCSSSDCTNSLINSIRATFDFFMSEKGKAYSAHYQSIVQPNFSKIGLSVIVVPEDRRYYLVVHYITE